MIVLLVGVLGGEVIIRLLLAVRLLSITSTTLEIYWTVGDVKNVNDSPLTAPSLAVMNTVYIFHPYKRQAKSTEPVATR